METTLKGEELFVEAKTGNKQWVAVLTDLDPKYKYKRDFVAYQRPATSDRASGRVTLNDGDIIEEVSYTHSGKNNSRWYYQYTNGELHEIEEIDIKAALDRIIVPSQEPTEEALADGGKRIDRSE